MLPISLSPFIAMSAQIYSLLTGETNTLACATSRHHSGPLPSHPIAGLPRSITLHESLDLPFHFTYFTG